MRLEKRFFAFFFISCFLLAVSADAQTPQVQFNNDNDITIKEGTIYKTDNANCGDRAVTTNQAVTGTDVLEVNLGKSSPIQDRLQILGGGTSDDNSVVQIFAGRGGGYSLLNFV